MYLTSLCNKNTEKHTHYNISSQYFITTFHHTISNISRHICCTILNCGELETKNLPYSNENSLITRKTKKHVTHDSIFHHNVLALIHTNVTTKFHRYRFINQIYFNISSQQCHLTMKPMCYSQNKKVV